MKQSFLRFEHWLSAIIIRAACVLLGIASTLGMMQVLSRFIFNQPISWSEVLIRLVIIWMVMFGVVIAFREGAQVSVDLMFRLSGRFQRPLHFVITVVAVLFLAVIIWYGFDITWRTRFQEIGGMEFLPMSVGYAALPVGAIFAVIAAVANYLDPKHNELETQQ
ncbi:TRAP transporter small permease [Propionivibrio soli]|uniref:TRAP transporter small permease n=1 Tax=Propionivibrio soli TaxID=2976531 RepID=UPI0021E8C45E|nr:TRAP transporter small permease [Propionivibrio soli]